MELVPRTELKGLAADRPLDADTFLNWLTEQPVDGFELVNGEVYRMAPERNWHAVYKANAYIALRSAIARVERDLHVFIDGPGVRVSDRTVREPDVCVNDGKVDPLALVIERPVILIEVVSETSRRQDFGTKLDEYFGIGSVQHYLVLIPETKRLIWHSRADAEGEILTRVLSEGDINLAPHDLNINVEHFFDDSPFE